MSEKDLVRRDRDRREHVTEHQPLAHLFTVPLDEVRRRVTTGSKRVGRQRREVRR